MNVNGAHGEASLNGLLGDKLVFPLLEHQLDLVTELTHAHHQFMHHAVEARISARERWKRPTNTQEQLAADLHGRTKVLGWVLLDAQHPLAKLLASVSKDE